MEERNHRIFKSNIVTTDTLAQIYKQGVSLECLCLQKCGIRKLPDNLFLFLPNVKFVDLRHNYLISLPRSLAFHQNIEYLLLSDNLFKTIPPILSSLPKLKETGLKGLQPGLRLSSSLEEHEASGPLISLRSKSSGVDSWGRRQESGSSIKMKKNLKITTMFISKKPQKSNKQIKRTCFRHWKNLTKGNILALLTTKRVLLFLIQNAESKKREKISRLPRKKFKPWKFLWT